MFSDSANFFKPCVDIYIYLFKKWSKWILTINEQQNYKTDFVFWKLPNDTDMR